MGEIDHAHQPENQGKSTCNEEIETGKRDSIEKGEDEPRHRTSHPLAALLVSRVVYKRNTLVSVNGPRLEFSKLCKSYSAFHAEERRH